MSGAITPAFQQIAGQLASLSAGLGVSDMAGRPALPGVAQSPMATPGGPSPSTANVQLMVPAPVWDWQVDPNGSTSAEAYEFCAWMPASALPGATYAPSAYRFTDSYAAFLQALPSSPLVTAATANFSASANQVLVLYAAGARLMPAWNVSGSPSQFLASVSGQGANPATIRVPLAMANEAAAAQSGLLSAYPSGATSGSPVTLPFAAGEVAYIDIHADAWAQILIRPGGWYNAALPALKHNGPFENGLTSVAFFGESGIMNCLVTGLLVGLNVSVVASLNQRLAGEIAGHTNPSSLLRVGGFDFRAQDVSIRQSIQPGWHEVCFPASAATRADGTAIEQTQPLMVAVSVAKL